MATFEWHKTSCDFVSIQLSALSGQLKTSYPADQFNGLKAKDYKFLAQGRELILNEYLPVSFKSTICSTICSALADT
ncbi:MULTISPECIES: hypothetical protein [unclassified Moorena]|uniref:hypothetical protein n=1 Tax=unclassified Moorena TaxID=2683338 RepID=UPI0013B700BE|nr:MULTISPECIES: hypothetical protein [unclassified Moorena]NEP35384.1 hypothetical protein [Moorena sp. SIO3B2]NEQ08871.1 hypothetical protein [Moorena sp. SIO4E2]NEQ15245.1 hypothetical protein [Moorena sp. SIO3E2]